MIFVLNRLTPERPPNPIDILSRLNSQLEQDFTENFQQSTNNEKKDSTKKINKTQNIS
jgi:hypothetical protein